MTNTPPDPDSNNVADVRVVSEQIGQVEITRWPDSLMRTLEDHEHRIAALEAGTEPPPQGPDPIVITDLMAHPETTEAVVAFTTDVASYASYNIDNSHYHTGNWGDGWTSHAHTFTGLTPGQTYRCDIEVWHPHDETPTEPVTRTSVTFTTNEVTVPPPIEPPVERPAAGGINIGMGNYHQGDGYWHSATPDMTTDDWKATKQRLGISHVRGNTAPAVERGGDKIIGQCEAILDAGLTLQLANHSWCTGADPQNHGAVANFFQRILLAGSDIINQAVADGRFIVSPWNEPSGHGTYSGGFEASVMHSDRWVSDHALVVEPLLSVAPDLRFDLGEPHGGCGGRRRETSCNAAYGPEMVRRYGNRFRADIHYYQGWKPGYVPDFIRMCEQEWPYPVTIGEFGGDIATLEERGKGPNHHSAIAYPPGDDMLEHIDQLAPYVDEFAMWTGYQSWWSGFVLSALQGRYAPWEVFDHPYMEIGGRFLAWLFGQSANLMLTNDLDVLAHELALAEVRGVTATNPDTRDPFTLAAEILEDDA